MLTCISQRYIFIILAHFGFFLIYATRLNLNVVIVAMVNSTYSSDQSKPDPECGKINDTQPIVNVSIYLMLNLKISLNPDLR